MKLAVVCASGIGDALIFQTLSQALETLWWETTTFSNHLPSFGSWLPQNARLAPDPSLSEIEEIFSPFDAIFLQHDNSPKAFKIKTLEIAVYSFYGAHVPSKHGPLSSARDYLCDREETMIENLRRAALQFFGVKALENGLKPPKGLVHRKNQKRIAIHPTASSQEKIWPREEFLRVADALKERGYDPVFTVSPKEQPEWGGPIFNSLADLASFIYESHAFLGNDSGPGHLASLLNIPHLIIAGDGLGLPLWKTGWYPGTYLAPPPWLMQLKLFRKRWPRFISVNNVIKNFNQSVLSN
jgi:hypothetical protein